MTDATSDRPSQVTVAGWVTMVAAGLLVLRAFDQMSSLHSVSMREEVQRALDTGLGRDLGLSVAEALAGLRWAILVMGAAAVAAAILGFFVLRRDRAARIGVTVATVPIVVCAPVLGGFLGAVVAASTAMLWSGPARDWFAGRPVRRTESPFVVRRERPAPEERGEPARPPAFVPPPEADESPGGEGPRPTLGYGASRPGAQFGAHRPSYPLERPRAVRTACLVAGIFTGVALAAAVVLGVVLAVDSASITDRITGLPEWEDAGLDASLLVPALWAWTTVLVLWCLGVLVLVWFTWRRSNGARITLIVSAIIAGVVGVFGFPFSLAHLVACASVVGLLVSPPVRAWFEGPRRGAGPGQGPPQGPPTGPPRPW